MTLICTLGDFHKKIYKLPIAFINNVVIQTKYSTAPTDYDFEKIKQSYSNSNASNKEIKLSLLVRKDSYFVMSNGKFSPDQIIEETDNVEMVKVSVTVEDTPKLRAFLRGLGNSVEVLTPHSLREYFKELAQSLLVKYQ